MSRLPILTVIFAAASAAQVGNVQNAAIYQPSVSRWFSASVPGAALVGYLGAFTLATPNIVSPRMLAVLSYPAPGPVATLFDPYSGVLLPQPPVPVNAVLSIRPVGSSTALPVTVTSSLTGAITFVVPAGIPPGGAELLYKIDNQPTQWTSLNVVPSSFEFFRIGPAGPALAQTFVNGSLVDVGLASPVQPGHTLVLTGSGIGNAPAATATIAGIPAPVTYAGPHPTLPGRDQIYIQIPAGAAVPDGCYLPLTITTSNRTVTTTVSKTSDGSPCNHPWQLSANDLQTLDSGGFLSDALIALSSGLNAVTPAAVSRSESASMSVGQINAAGIAAYFAPVSPVTAPACSSYAPVGIAQVISGEFFNVGPPPPPLPDLGPSVTLQGPAITIPLTGSNGYYSASLPPAADGPPSPLVGGGNWTWRSTGGKDLPASSFPFTLPPPIQLNGPAPLSIRRDQDLTLTWNSAAFDATTVVHFYFNGTGSAQISCTAPGNASSLTVPSALLSGYAAGTLGSLTTNATGTVPHAQFKLQNGATLLMLVQASSTDSRPLSFQ